MKAFYFLASIIIFSSCEPNYNKQFKSAVKSHMLATSPLETLNCGFIAENMNSDSAIDFCASLSSLSTPEVAVCEDELRLRVASSLIPFCKEAVKHKLLLLETIRNEGLSMVTYPQLNTNAIINFKLPTVVQYRDLSSGYLVTHGDIEPMQVILTFDDGPHPMVTDSILNTLKQTNTLVHFFNLGEHVKSYPEVTRRVGAAGHSVGNHSWNHPNMLNLDFSEIQNQIVSTHQIIFKTLGWVDPFFRFPYGSRNSEAEKYLYANQAANFLWNVDSNDWKKIDDDGTLRTNLKIINDVMAQIKRRGRGHVLFHDVHLRTAELLPELLKQLYENKYQIVMLQPTDANLKKHSGLLYPTPIIDENR